MRRARWGILAGVLAVAPPAWGADPAERDAQARFDEGIVRVKAGDLEGALLSFRQAYALVHRPVIVWNLALVEEKTTTPWTRSLTSRSTSACRSRSPTVRAVRSTSTR